MPPGKYPFCSRSSQRRFRFRLRRGFRTGFANDFGLFHQNGGDLHCHLGRWGDQQLECPCCQGVSEPKEPEERRNWWWEGPNGTTLHTHDRNVGLCRTFLHSTDPPASPAGRRASWRGRVRGRAQRSRRRVRVAPRRKRPDRRPLAARHRGSDRWQTARRR